MNVIISYIRNLSQVNHTRKTKLIDKTKSKWKPMLNHKMQVRDNLSAERTSVRSFYEN